MGGWAARWQAKGGGGAFLATTTCTPTPLLNAPRVLVVDGGASKRCALLGDNIAEMAHKNGWRTGGWGALAFTSGCHPKDAHPASRRVACPDQLPVLPGPCRLERHHHQRLHPGQR